MKAFVLFHSLIFLFSASLLAQVAIPMDAGFGSGGFASLPEGGNVESILRLANGKILGTYTSSDEDGIPVFQSFMLQANGKVDSTFGENGFAFMSTGTTHQQMLNAVLGDNNKFYALGACQNDDSDDRYFGRLFRFDLNGTRDMGFGNSGAISIRPNADTSFQVRKLERTSTGKLLIAGTFADGFPADEFNLGLLQLLPDGRRDVSFGNLGWAKISPTVVHEIRVSDMWQEASGSILVCGTGFVQGSPGSGIKVFVSRFLSNGQVDASFGTNGLVTRSFTNINGWLDAKILLASNGKIIIGGRYANGINAFRLSASGQIESNFGTGGLFTYPIQIPAFEVGLGLVEDNAGGILMGTQQSDGSVVRIFLGRLLSQGQIDANFGTSGLYTMSFPGTLATRFSDLQLWDGNRLVCFGAHRSAADGDFGMVAKADLSQILFVGEFRHSNASQAFYPNPARDFLFVNDPEFQNESLEVIDIQGKVFALENLAEQDGRTRFDLAGIPRGLYVLRCAQIGKILGRLAKE